LLPIFRDQIATLVDSKTGEARFDDYAALIGAPAIAAAVSVIAGWRLSIVNELISALAIITALLFGMVVFIFQLRIQLGAREVMERTPRTTIELVDEMFSNVCYAIVVGFATIAATLIGAALRSDLETGGTGPIGVSGTAVILFLALHFALVLAMCLKRLVSAYKKVSGR
jgi:hypothetical protein